MFFFVCLFDWFLFLILFIFLIVQYHFNSLEVVSGEVITVQNRKKVIDQVQYTKEIFKKKKAKTIVWKLKLSKIRAKMLREKNFFCNLKIS